MENLGHGSLVDTVFSWTLNDVFNEKLFKHEVRKIPKTFHSIKDYMKSFIPALIEETHSDLSSSLMSVSQAPFSEISTIQRSNDFQLPYGLLYEITVKSITDEVKGARKYEPETGDIIAFTNVKPRRIDDLKMTKDYCHIAYVLKSPDVFSDEITILTSKFMENDIEIDVRSNKSQKLYAVYLMNMTTNIGFFVNLGSF